MKKAVIPFGLIVLIMAILYNFGLPLFTSSPDSTNIENAGVAAKHGPADHFFLQRSYPDNQFSQKAYLKGMRQVKEQQLQRSSNPGFDTDWTTQGPGSAGARVNVVLVHPTDPTTIYLGYSGGGIFKTTDNGNSWQPIFDDQPYLAIGDMAFHPTDPEIIFVGTGDPSITGYPFIGNGIYKTTDGGQTWTNLGLSETYIVSKIVIHPTDPDIIYAGTMGLPFMRTNDRGLYKTDDGGQTWEQVLFIDSSTGITDIVIHPTDPDIIFAGIWTRIRNNQESTLTSFGHKVYRSQDAGETWQPLANGLPIGNGSRISLSQSQQNPNTFFACFTTPSHQFNGLFRTTDSGDNWTEIANTNTPFINNCMFGFGWYLGRLRVNPFNDNEMFVLGVPLVSSQDGGITWGEAAPNNVHVDNHGIAFSSDGSVVLGNDGGAYRRPPGGTIFWQDIEDIPATQVYRVAYNPFEPDTYYGGFQDNGTQSGNASSIDDWDMIRGADGFQMAFNPDDSLNFYAETQNGGIGVSNNGFSFSSGTNGIISSDRRNWDMPYFISPHQSDHLYTGTFRVYKTTNRAADWDAISPDLTDGVVFSPGFHTISTIDESPVDPGRLYVGTTDANVWRTTDDGENWEEIKSGLPTRYITSIKASPIFSETVYVTLSGYRDNENTPFVFRSENGGTTWDNIAGNLPPMAVNDILILPRHQDTVLIVANDAGVYASLDAGTNWDRLGGNFPTVPVYDLVYNEVNNQVVAGSHGRSILSFDLDNIGLFESVQISGNVYDWQDRPIPEVNISVANSAVASQVTGATGNFDFPKIPVDLESCEITLSKNTNTANGVGIFDVIQLQQHILELDTFDNPYQILAADVNLSGTLSAFDLIFMRRVILRIDTVFSETESWRFIPASHTFSDPFDPWASEIPWSGNCSDVASASEVMDFVAIKMGDLNASSNPDLLLAGDTRESFILNMEDLRLEKDQEYTFTIPEAQLEDVLGMAWQLEFDPVKATVLSVEKGPHAEDEFMLFDNYKNSRWTGMAGSISENTLANLEHTFTWKIRANQSGFLSEVLSLSKEYPSHVLRKDKTRQNLLLQFTETSVEKENDPSFLSVTISPNPFQEAPIISLRSPLAGSYDLSVLDNTGKRLLLKKIRIETTENRISLSDEIFKESGIYWLLIQNKEQKIVKKLIKL